MQIKYQFSLWAYNTPTDPVAILNSEFRKSWPDLVEAKEELPYLIRISTFERPSLKFWRAIRAVPGIGGVVDSSSYLSDIDMHLYQASEDPNFFLGDLIIVSCTQSAFLLRTGYFFSKNGDGSANCHIVIDGKLQQLTFEFHEIQKLKEM